MCVCEQTQNVGVPVPRPLGSVRRGRGAVDELCPTAPSVPVPRPLGSVRREGVLSKSCMPDGAQTAVQGEEDDAQADSRCHVAEKHQRFNIHVQTSITTRRW